MATYSGKLKFVNDNSTLAIVQDTTISGDSSVRYALVKGDLSLAQKPQTGVIVEDITYEDAPASTIWDIVHSTDPKVKRGTREKLMSILTYKTVGYSLVLTKADIADGYRGKAYSQTLTASGGTGPYTYSVVTGTLPAGLTLTAGTGVIAGTPTATGNFTIKFRVTDSKSKTDDHIINFSIGIEPLSITTTTLNAMQRTVAFSQTLAGNGGYGSLTWTVSSGTLPAGLSLSTAGVLSGTPTTAATYNFVVQAADTTTLRAIRDYTVTVAS